MGKRIHTMSGNWCIKHRVMAHLSSRRKRSDRGMTVKIIKSD